MAKTRIVYALVLVLAACGGYPSAYEDANMSARDLSGQDLSHTLFRNVDLSGANLAGANLAGSRLDHCDLRGADLEGANLVGAQFPHSDLSGANLSNARTDASTSFPHTTLVHARLDGVGRFSCAWCSCPDGDRIPMTMGGCDRHRDRAPSEGPDSAAAQAVAARSTATSL